MHRGLHGKESQNLEQVVLDDIADDAKLVKVAAPAFGAKVFAEYDLQPEPRQQCHTIVFTTGHLNMLCMDSTLGMNLTCPLFSKVIPWQSCLKLALSCCTMMTNSVGSLPGRCGCTAGTTTAQRPDWRSAAPAGSGLQGPVNDSSPDLFLAAE